MTPPTADKPNGDLKAGDRIVITSWCREKTYVRVKASGGLISVGTTGDAEADNTQINRAFFGDVLEVLAVHYPRVLVDVHSISAGPTDYTRVRTVLDAQDFECERADEAYVAAVMSGRKSEAAKQRDGETGGAGAGTGVGLGAARPRLKASLVLAVLLCLAFFGVVEVARLLGLR